MRSIDGLGDAVQPRWRRFLIPTSRNCGTWITCLPDANQCCTAGSKLGLPAIGAVFLNRTVSCGEVMDSVLEGMSQELEQKAPLRGAESNTDWE